MERQVRTLKEHILRRFPTSNLVPLDDTQLAALQKKYPAIPEEYLVLLQIVGWGGIGGSHFMIYSSPIEPDEVFDIVTAAELANVLLLGDDFCGNHAAYLTTRDPWTFVEIDHSSPSDFVTGEWSSFVDYLNFWCNQEGP